MVLTTKEKEYMMAALFNAGSMIGSYYRTEVNHDMPQFEKQTYLSSMTHTSLC